MALPLLASLSLFARTTLPIIESGVSKGLTGKAISDTIKATYGKSIRNQTLFGVIREIKAQQLYSQRLKFINKSRLIDVNRIPNALTSLRRKYSFIVKVQGILKATGEPFTQRITVSSNTSLSVGEIERLAAGTVTDDDERYGMLVEKTLVEKALRDPGNN